MLTLRKGSSRKHTLRAGLETWSTFNPEDRGDPFGGGFRALEVFNEKILAPGRAMPRRARKDMETLTYVLDGLLLHEDDLGNSETIRPGEFQLMSAGNGMSHRRFNGSHLNSARVFEGRVRSDKEGRRPECAQKRFTAADRRANFCLVASPDGLRSSFRIRQDVQAYSSLPDRGCHLIHGLKPGRRAWLHVVGGHLQLLHLDLIAGDGVGFEDEASVSVTALESSELLLFDLG